MRTAWSDAETRDALALSEADFLARYPHRNPAALRQKVEHLLVGHGLTYGQFRLQQGIELGEARAAARLAEPKRAPGMPEPLPDDPDALERLFAAYKEVHCAAKALGGKPGKRLDWNPPDDRPVGIAFLGDVHAGGDIEIERFEEDVQTIAATDGLYGILMGDLVNNFKPQAKSGTGLYGDLFSHPDLQNAYVHSRLRWASGKWLALLEGNHEGFDGRWAGIDRLPGLARALGAEYFTETGGSVFVTLGDQTYHIVARHNNAGNSQINKGNAARRLWDSWPWAWENADVVALAHTHEPHLEQVMRKGELVTYLHSGTYKTHDEWSENNGWRPAYGVPLVVLYPDRKEIIPFHGAQFAAGVRFLERERRAAAKPELMALPMAAD